MLSGTCDPLTTLHTPRILASMDTPSAPPAAPVPFYRKVADRRTKLSGFRIYVDQHIKLTHEYEGTSSALVRELLDCYFKGELPNVEAKLKQSKQLQH